MGGGADGEDPGGTPPPEDVAGIDLDPEQHSKDEPEPDPAAAHGTADAQSESIGTEDSASGYDPEHDPEHDPWNDDYDYDPGGDPDAPIYIGSELLEDVVDPAGVPWPAIPDDWDPGLGDNSGESDAESGEYSDDDDDDDYDSDLDGDMSGFDEDAMHFEIEGTTSQASNRACDPEERGHYLLHDGRVPSSRTGMNHQQGSDSVCAAGDGLLLVTGDVDVRLVDANAIVADGAYDADGRFNNEGFIAEGGAGRFNEGFIAEGADGPNGPNGPDALPSSSTTEYVAKQELPFSVYSVDYDESSRLVAVCGDVRRYAQDVNLAVFRVVRHQGTNATGRAPASASFVPVAERGVGAMGRFGRDMVNCVRFGKRVKAASDGVHLDGVHRALTGGGKRAIEDVLLCASQDGNCYVMSVDVKDDAGGALEPALEPDDDDANEDGAGRVGGFSPGGQGGRGPRRRPRLDARLVECCKIAFPAASNAAAASPDGSCVAVCGDAEFVLVNGGPDGYGDHGATRHLAINGDPSAAGVVSGEAAGGMYVAWSPTSEYLAATSDSLHALAVWRVTTHTRDDSRADEAGGVSAGDVSGDVVDRESAAYVNNGSRSVPSEGLGLTLNPKPSARARGGAVVGPLRIQRVAYFRDHAHPCLPVRFLPSDGHVVVWAERGGRVHAYDLRCAHAASPGSSSAVNLSPPPEEDGYPRGRGFDTGAGRGADEDSMITVLGADDDEEDGVGSGAGEDGSDEGLGGEPAGRSEGVEAAGPEGVEVCLQPVHRSFRTRLRRGAADDDQRRFVQTIRSRVRGKYVTGLCVVAAANTPPPASPSRGSPARIDGSRAPPRDFVFVGTPDGVLRFRCPVAWTPETHQDFPVAFRKASRAFVQCAAADFTRKAETGDEESSSALSLGDLPQEVLLHIVGLAAVPLSDWANVS